MEGLLNLENLSKEERNQILLVLRKDDLIRQTEDRKISQLKQEIQALRMRSVLRDGDDLSKMCARCHAELGMFFNRGEMCPKCHFRVCKLCQECLLNGSWLCLLCYKQRQLKWFLGDWEPGKPTRWPSGADMVKASLKKKHLIKGGTGSVGDNIDHSKDEIQNGNPMQNGTARSEKHSAERLEFPRDSDQRKLTQLFDNFKLPRKKEPAQETKHVKRISSRKYSDSESEESDSSTSGNDELVETIKHSPHKNAGSKEHLPEPPPDYDDDERDHIFKENDAHEVKRNTADNSDRKMLNRTHSDDSDQTLLSDDVPFSKSSTETQIKVDIQSDSPKSSPNLDHHRIPKSKSDLPEKPRETKTIKQSATDIIMALKLGKRQSPVPKKSLSPDVGGKKQSVSRQPNDLQFQAGRSPSPFSFDSLPSSHAASPLPQKRLADLAVECNTSKESDTDSMSQLSATDVHESSSGADDCTVEELSKVHFRRISARSPGRTSSSSPKKTDSGPTKLSPRASSEGSGSFEDSGLVSGASTENTPEHRRTDSIQSQLSVPSSTISNITDKSSEEADIDDIVATHRSHGSGRGNLLSTIAGSRESILSVYSNAGEVDYGKIPVTGEILLGMDYNYRTGTLEVLVKQCKELAPADTRRNRSDPYVKTYLLPDKTRGGKRKTRIQKNTLNPIFEQTLRYLISKSELENRTLSVTVWHNDRFGRNDFLGEVSINFDYFRFGDSAPKWYTLQEKVETHPTSNLTYRGDLFLSLRYVPPENVSKEDVVVSPSKKKIKKGKSESTPSKGQLHVKIKEARNLTAIRTGGYSDPFVKGYLLPDKHRQVKQKTPVIKRNCNPTWNHTFIFDEVKKDDLKDRCLELTVWDYDKITSNEFLGGIRLNQGVGRSHGKTVDWMDAHGEEISLWQAMMDRPDIWIDGALMLRPNMEKRKF